MGEIGVQDAGVGHHLVGRGEPPESEHDQDAAVFPLWPEPGRGEDTEGANSKLDGVDNRAVLRQKSQSKLYFLKSLKSQVSSRLLGMLYQSFLASMHFYSMVCRGSS